MLVGKKSTAVVPVEQFKTFSVYEDYNPEEKVEQQSAVGAAVKKQNETNAATTISHDVAVVDKENICYEKQRQQQHQQKQQQQQQRFQQQHILTDRR